MRVLVTHDSGGSAALTGLVLRLRARAAQHGHGGARGEALGRDDDLAVATSRLERKQASWTR
jgi:hypothetical protein